MLFTADVTWCEHETAFMLSLCKGLGTTTVKNKPMSMKLFSICNALVRIAGSSVGGDGCEWEAHSKMSFSHSPAVKPVVCLHSLSKSKAREPGEANSDQPIPPLENQLEFQPQPDTPDLRVQVIYLH